MTNQSPQPDVTRFDRLVDGELSSAEYQALLAALDEEPDGWRRCALSFLEAQALERELGSLREERVAQTSAPAPSPALQTGVRRVGYPLMALAMAASFLVAFGMGLAIRSEPSTGSPGGGQVAETIASPKPQPDDRAIAQSEQRSTDSGRAHSSYAERSDQPLGNVELVVDGDRLSDQQRVEVPLYSFDQVGQDYFTSDHSALPPEVREMLERQGHELRSYRQLVPMRLHNGQQAVFPMEEVEVVPVRMPAF